MMSNCKLCLADCAFKGKDMKKGNCKGYISMSNADRIRAMSDEELAEYLCGLTYCCECEHRDTCNGEDGYLKWLRQLAEEDT